MKLFVSWSGPASHGIACAFRDWLPLFFTGLQPFVSSQDIEKGQRWAEELDRELSQTDFGLVCLTPYNLHSPWLLYESGALAKSVDTSRVFTLFYKVAPRDVGFPLARFQGTSLDKTDVRSLLQSINSHHDDACHTKEQLDTLFDALWPRLEETLAVVDEEAENQPRPDVSRSDNEVLDELLSRVREISQMVEDQVAYTAFDSPKEREIPILRASWTDSRPQPPATDSKRGSTSGE